MLTHCSKTAAKADKSLGLIRRSLKPCSAEVKEESLYIALTLVGPSKCLKQIIQTALNRVKNPNWPREANQLTTYKHGQGFELGTTVNKSSSRSEQDLNSGPLGYKSSALTTWPRYLL